VGALDRVSAAGRSLRGEEVVALHGDPDEPGYALLHPHSTSSAHGKSASTTLLRHHPAGELKVTAVGKQTYHVTLGGKSIGRVGHVVLEKAGKGWMAWDESGAELDAFEATRAEAVGILVKSVSKK
jgi:hypothetical protein